MSSLSFRSPEARRLTPDDVAKWRLVILAMLVSGVVSVEAALATPAVYASNDAVAQAVVVIFAALAVFMAAFPKLVVERTIAVAWLIVLVTTVEISLLVAVVRGVPALPLFYAWPLLSASFLFSRRDFLLAMLWAAIAYALALLPLFHHAVFPWVNYALVLAASLVTLSAVRALSETTNRLFHELPRPAALDPLTEVLNRRSFDERGQLIWDESLLTGAPLVAVVMDLDHFKSINDRFGHAIGDAALQHVAGLLRTSFRECDLIARTGGEEFAVVLPDTDLNSALAMTEYFRDTLGRSRTNEGARLTVSIGLATRGSEPTIQALLVAADRATYTAKDQGRDRVVVAPRSGDPGPLTRPDHPTGFMVKERRWPQQGSNPRPTDSI